MNSSDGANGDQDEKPDDNKGDQHNNNQSSLLTAEELNIELEELGIEFWTELTTETPTETPDNIKIPS